MSSVALLAVALVVAFVLIAVVLNHGYARLALVELTLNEGLPPGYEAPTTLATQNAVPQRDPTSTLGPGVHIFLSRSCHACQRLLDELDQTTIDSSIGTQLHYVDRPRPLATATAQRLGATLHHHQAELTQGLGADPLPYTIAVGSHGLVGRSVTPTVHQIQHTARDAGIQLDYRPLDESAE